ncbi:ABC transporter ATP-binding protein [Sediminispirochaeta smaragdinae]|uniref:ABC transporter related protein n=1 Tax=Sediminispirochaeta smaragdinae (strain DSM 11293 / JCM 15392 / SEBR 4228) TaxID=573413 RepID=E1R2Q2_SEDSS|nr:energy-coupling factor transporter ATPase [Sediminispirochaeta smaragdinae]ADK80334.1 ABC transporter related protein [Sediminispirochaeta smaragdinae DSM 11293]
MSEYEGSVYLRDFCFAFPDSETPFLKNIDISINKGEFVIITGPSSSGKSTLALCLVGIYPKVLGGSTSGTIKVGGLNVHKVETEDISTKAGIVFQDPDSQFCNLFVDEEVAFGPENLLVKATEISDRVNKYLKFVNLPKYNNKKIAELSGGQKQRVAIASVLAMEPEILILDQPTANLDPSGKEDIYETLYKLNQETGLTLILIEHQIDELIKYVDKLIIMEDGKVIESGVPRDIFRHKSQQLEQDYGLWVPEICRLSFAIEETGFEFDRFPITVQEFVEQKEILFPCLSSTKTIEKKENYAKKTALEIKDLSFGYSSQKKLLQDLSLSINKGSIIAVMGENGSGKTTLSMNIIGLLKSQSGTIILDSQDITDQKVSHRCRKIGYVFQYPDHQFITNSVAEEIAYGLKQTSLSQQQIDDIVKDTLKTVELEGLEERHPLTLGMGEKRRLSIATMIVQRPQILILDEPSAGLDYKNCKHMMDIILKMCKEGVTIIMITHTTYLVAKYADAVILLDKGQKVFDGKPEDLFNNLEAIKTKAIEKPEILKVFDCINSKGKIMDQCLVADDLIEALNRR